MTKCKQVIDWDNNINIIESDVNNTENDRSDPETRFLYSWLDYTCFSAKHTNR